MKRVFKYTDDGNGKFIIYAPTKCRFGQVIHFDYVDQAFRVWVEVYDCEKVLPGYDNTRTLHVAGTGHDIDPSDRHIKSITCNNGVFIWHLYEKVS